MKVIHVLKSNIYSGAENVVCTIIENASVDVEHVYVSPSGPIDSILENKCIHHYKIDKLSYQSVRSAIRELKPDIIHAHDFSATIFCAWASIGINTSVISHLHSNPKWFERINIRNIMFLIANIRIKRVLIVSNQVMEKAFFKRILKKKSVNVGNPFSIENICKRVDNNMGKHSDLLYVGRLSKEKNPLSFLRIVEKVAGIIPNIKAIVVGDGQMLQECQQIVETRDTLRGIVEFVGFQKNPYNYINKTRVICITSEYEGFGLVALEAMSLGKPVVCKAVGGLKTIMHEIKENMNDEEDFLVERIVNLLNDQELYIRQSKLAQNTALKYDNLSEYREKIEKVYSFCKY